MPKKLFVVVLRYLVETKTIDELRVQHVVWLDEQYERKIFLASGRQTPGSGGVIIAQAENRQQVTLLIASDPFYTHGAAEYQIFEFAPSKMASELVGALNWTLA